jgi:hypothetical protein
MVGMRGHERPGGTADTATATLAVGQHEYALTQRGQQVSGQCSLPGRAGAHRGGGQRVGATFGCAPITHLSATVRDVRSIGSGWGSPAAVTDGDDSNGGSSPLAPLAVLVPLVNVRRHGARSQPTTPAMAVPSGSGTGQIFRGGWRSRVRRWLRPLETAVGDAVRSRRAGDFAWCTQERPCSMECST